MYKDIFVEKIVARRPTAQSRLTKVGVLVAEAGMIYVLLMMMLNIPDFSVVFMLAIVGSIWGTIKLVRMQNVEFEYALTNGELDVDRILAQTNRKRLVSINVQSFELLAPFTEENTQTYKGQTFTFLDVSSGADAEGRWFAVFPGKDGRRTMLIFEPDESFVDGIAGIIPRKVVRA